MSKRAGLFLLLVAGVLAVGYWLWPEDESATDESTAEDRANPEAEEPAEPSDRPETPTVSAEADDSAGVSPAAAPVRMRSSRPPGAESALASRFASEERDDEWARAREGEVAKRARTVLASAAEGKKGQGAVKAGKVECRQRSCVVPLASPDPVALARAIEWLGEEQGFYRYADDMMVEAVERDEHGPRSVRVYLRFSR